MQSKGLQELKDLALQDSRWKHPTLPAKWLSIRNYNDRTANGLTKCIIDYVRFNGYLAERITCTGRPLDNTQIVTDVLGDSRKIGTITWLPTSGQKGTADISAIIRGHSVKIEVKMKDRQSPDQKAYQEQVEKAGGVYWLCHSFDEFLGFYKEFK